MYDCGLDFTFSFSRLPWNIQYLHFLCFQRLRCGWVQSEEIRDRARARVSCAKSNEGHLPHHVRDTYSRSTQFSTFDVQIQCRWSLCHNHPLEYDRQIECITMNICQGGGHMYQRWFLHSRLLLFNVTEATHERLGAIELECVRLKVEVRKIRSNLFHDTHLLPAMVKRKTICKGASIFSWI